LILSHFEQNRTTLNYTSFATTTWVLGKKHIFLSECARQQLELVRNQRRILAAVTIQAFWRGCNTRRKWPFFNRKQGSGLFLSSSKFSSLNFAFGPDSKMRPPRPQPITGTPPPLGNQTSVPAFCSKPTEICDLNLVRGACTLLGLNSVILSTISLFHL